MVYITHPETNRELVNINKKVIKKALKDKYIRENERARNNSNIVDSILKKNDSSPPQSSRAINGDGNSPEFNLSNCIINPNQFEKQGYLLTRDVIEFIKLLKEESRKVKYKTDILKILDKLAGEKLSND